MAPQWLTRTFGGITQRLRPTKSKNSGRPDTLAVPPAEHLSTENITHIDNDSCHQVPPSVTNEDSPPKTDTGSSAAPPGESPEPLSDSNESLGGISADGSPLTEHAQILSDNFDISHNVSQSTPDPPLAEPMGSSTTFTTTYPTPMDTSLTPNLDHTLVSPGGFSKPSAPAPLLFGDDQPAHTDYGFKVLAPGVNPIVDVILVHGLDGHRLNSFTAGGVCWPQTILPKLCLHARILTYGYNSTTGGDEGTISSQSFHQHGTDLVGKLAMWRRFTQTQEQHPIIFLAYSTGGLIVKHALNMASASNESSIRNLKLATSGIVFLGTPQQGISCQEFQVYLENVSAITTRSVVNDIKRDSEHIYQLLDDFTNIGGDFVTKVAYEVLSTRLPNGKYVVLVPRATAVLPGASNVESIGMNKNHHTIAKFTSEDDNDFFTMACWLSEMIRDAPSRVSHNFEAEMMQTGVVDTPPAYEYGSRNQAINHGSEYQPPKLVIREVDNVQVRPPVDFKGTLPAWVGPTSRAIPA